MKENNHQWSSPIRYMALVGLIIFIGAVVYFSQDTLNLIIAVAIIAYILSPVVNFFVRKLHMGRGFAVILSYLILIILIIVLLVLIVPVITGQIQEFLNTDWPTVINSIDSWLEGMIRQLEVQEVRIGNVKVDLSVPLIELRGKLNSIDIEDLNRPFELRLSDLEYFDNIYFEGDSYNKDGNIKFVPHKKVSGYLFAKKWHDIYVEEGFEGIVLRDPDKEYGINKRDNRMIKMKEYQDDEFKIIGWKEGLRGVEDMTFTCLCAGMKFDAKPMGDRALKEEYVEVMDQLIGKMAIVKFFNYTEKGIPSQPVLKSIREYGE